MKTIPMIAACSLALLGACQTDGDDTLIDPIDLDEPVAIHKLSYTDDALPVAESITYRATMHAWQDGKIIDQRPVPSLTARIVADGDGRRVELRGDPSIDGVVTTDRHGRVRDGLRTTATAGDLLAQLPPPDRAVQIGVPYLSQPPLDAQVRANLDAGSLTMTQQIESTPIAIWEIGDARIVRLDTRATNLFSVYDAEGVLHHVPLGFAFRGITDLIYAPGRGWRVARMTHLMPTAATEHEPSLAELRRGPHLAFTACSVKSSALDVRRIAAKTPTDVPEFASCDQ